MKLPYLSTWDVTSATIEITGGMSEDGEAEALGTWTGKVNFSEKVRRVQNTDGVWTNLAGVIHIEGDILPGVVFREGSVRLAEYDRTFNIVSYARPRNPDGSVHHTRIEVI